MKAEYIPPKEDVIIQNETPEEVYILVSGEIEIIDCVMDVERIVGKLHCGSMFGEVGALCCKNHNFTYRTKTLSQLLKLKTSVLQEAMHGKPEDSIAIINNFLQVRILFHLHFSMQLDFRGYKSLENITRSRKEHLTSFFFFSFVLGFYLSSGLFGSDFQ